MNRAYQVAACSIFLFLTLVVLPTSTRADDEITVKRFVIDGADSLSPSQIEQVKASVLGMPGNREALMDTARRLLTNFLEKQCYLRADIELEVINANDAPNWAWMQAKVGQGVRYRLRDFRVQWARAFSVQQIGQQLPLDAMRRGNCSGLSNAPTTISDFYLSHGLRNVKVHPLVQANKATQQFDLTLYIDEGQ